MNHLQPMQLLGLIFFGGCTLLGLWVLGLPAQTRLARLQRIMQVEAAQTVPPTTLQAQAEWLVQHRLQVGQRLTLLLALALVIGVGEGVVARTTDRWRGVRVRAWTIGRIGAGLTLALGIVGLIYPAPVPLTLLAGLATGAVGVIGYLLAVGYPAMA